MVASQGSAYPPSAPIMSPDRETVIVVTCTWIAHLSRPTSESSDLVVGDQIFLSDTHVVSWYYCSLNVVGAHVLPFGARWSLRAAASTDGKNVGSMEKIATAAAVWSSTPAVGLIESFWIAAASSSPSSCKLLAGGTCKSVRVSAENFSGDTCA